MRTSAKIFPLMFAAMSCLCAAAEPPAATPAAPAAQTSDQRVAKTRMGEQARKDLAAQRRAMDLSAYEDPNTPAMRIEKDNALSSEAKQAALLALAQSGDAQAQCLYANRLWSRYPGSPGDLAGARSWLEKAAQQGWKPAVLALADMEKLPGVPPSDPPGKWRLCAAELGSLRHIRELAEDYQFGHGGLPRDAEKSLEWRTRAALLGDRFAQIKLGDYYAKADVGTGSRDGANFEEALKWYLMAAEGGYDLAQFKVAETYLRLGATPENLECAYAWAHTAAAQKDAQAYRLLADLYYYGWGTPRDVAASFDWMNRVAEGDRGWLWAVNYDRMALAYLRGDGVKPSAAKARFYWFKGRQEGLKNPTLYLDNVDEAPWRAVGDAESGGLPTGEASDDAQALYRYGRSSPSDSAQGLAALRAAAAKNHVLAQCAVAERLQRNFGGGPACDAQKKEAFDWLTRAAGQGYPPAYYALADCYLRGQGVEKDRAQALAWLRKAAQAGVPSAVKHMGDVYAYGIGVPQDYEQARRWYTEAAARDNDVARMRLIDYYAYGIGGEAYPQGVFEQARALSMQKKFFHGALALGLCYLDGRGTPPDDAKAFESFAQAARAGNDEALFYLAQCYAQGRGVEKSPEKAAACLREQIRVKNTPRGCFGGGPDIHLPE